MANGDLDTQMREGAKERGLSQFDFQAQSQRTPPPKNFLARLTGSVKGFVQGWMDPGKPLNPVAPEGQPPRQYDYPLAYNVNIAPRPGEIHGFEELMALSNYSLVRFVLENRKDQVAKLAYKVQPKDKNVKGPTDDPGIKKIEELFSHMDGEHDFPTMVRSILEQVLVLDALTMEPVMDPSGTVQYFQGIHGATIALKMDERGRTPKPPNVAYQQVIKGIPYADFTTDNLIYKPWNVRFSHVYGFSKVEQLLMIINIGLRRELRQLYEFTSGSLPTALMSTPESWTPAQIKEYNSYWDTTYGGNLQKRSNLVFVPHGSGPVIEKEPVLKNEFDEWLIRVICFVFGMQPMAFVREMNRATSETAKEAAIKEGVEPLMIFLKTLFDLMIQKFLMRPDLEFVWTDESQVDPKVEMDVRTGYVKVGVVSVDEVRRDMGLEPIGMTHAAYTASGPVLLSKIISGEITPGQGKGPLPGEEDFEPVLPATKAAKKKTVVQLPLPGEEKRIRSLTKAVHKALNAAKPDELVKQIWKAIEPRLIELGKADKSAEDEKKKNKSLADDTADELDLDPITQALPAAVSAELVDVAGLSCKQAFLQVYEGSDVDEMLSLLDTEAVKWAENHSAEMVGMKWDGDQLVENPNAAYSITESTREMLKGDILNAINQGQSVDTLASRIAESPFSERRANLIAQTEVKMAHNASNIAGWRASEQVTGKESLLSDDHPEEDICDECADEGTIPLEEQFASGEDTPPHHPGCFCSCRAILGSESGPDED